MSKFHDLRISVLIPTSSTLRLAGAELTEEQMRGALHSIEDDLGPVSEFTAMIDERSIPRALKFIVEPEHGA